MPISRTQVADKVTDADVKARDEKEIAASPAENEVHARHICETEDEAKEVIKLLEGGAKFEDVAKEKSTDGAAAQGGDLVISAAGKWCRNLKRPRWT